MSEPFPEDPQVTVAAIHGTTQESTTPTTFVKELEALINKHSMENGSNTPDFILAKFLRAVLDDFDQAVRARDTGIARTPHPPGF